MNPPEQKHYLKTYRLHNDVSEMHCVCGDPACTKVDYMGGEKATRASGEDHLSPSPHPCCTCGQEAEINKMGKWYCNKHYVPYY